MCSIGCATWLNQPFISFSVETREYNKERKSGLRIWDYEVYNGRLRSLSDFYLTEKTEELEEEEDRLFSC